MSKPRVLRILDIGPFIHACKVNKRSFLESELEETPAGYETRQIPTGGISFIFNQIEEHAEYDRIVLCADRPPYKKCELYADYKAGRSTSDDEDVDNQKDLAEIILEDCGFQILSQEGYEADDLIYSLCEKYKHEYDKIYVYTNDHDLYVVVDENVEIAPKSEKDKHITKENFETTASGKRLLPYNTITFDKIINGCGSDNVPALEPYTLRQSLFQFCNRKEMFPMMRNKAYLETIIKNKFPEAMTQFKLIFPVTLDVHIEDREPVIQKCIEWGNLLKNRRFPTLKKIAKSTLSLKDSFF